jgi:hypothetical protein
MIAEDAVDDRENFGLIAVYDFGESEVVMSLDAPDEIRFFASLVIHSSPGAGPLA